MVDEERMKSVSGFSWLHHLPEHVELTNQGATGKQPLNNGGGYYV